MPAERAGRALGLFHGATGIGVLIASIWAGLAWGFGARVPLMVSGVAALLLAVALAAGGHFLDRERAAPLP